MKKIILTLLLTFIYPQQNNNTYNESWGLIIGINKYQNVSKLDFAVDDAQAINSMLIETFQFAEENITILLDENATKDNIVKAFSEIALKAREGDRVLVFYAGHGETMELAEGGQMGYLIPVDGDAENLYYSSIPMGELKNLAMMSKAKHMLYLVDACYGGLAAVGSRGLSVETPNYIKKVLSDKARQVITAGGKGEKVIEKSEWGHSAFTLNLKRGLKEGRADINYDGYITARELGMFLSEKVSIDSENQQTPQFARMTSQEGEFVFEYATEFDNSDETVSADKKLEILLARLENLDNANKGSDVTINERSTNFNKYFNNQGGLDRPSLGFIYINNNSFINISKSFFNEKSFFGIGYSLDGQQGFLFDTFHTTSRSYGDNVNISYQRLIANYSYFPLNNKESRLFNPAGIVNLTVNFINMENYTENLSANNYYFDYTVGLFNQIKVFNIVRIGVGVSVGYSAFYDFTTKSNNQESELFQYARDIEYTPTFMIDLPIPNLNFFNKK